MSSVERIIRVLTKQDHSLATLHREVAQFCKAHELQMPARTALWNALSDFDTDEVQSVCLLPSSRLAPSPTVISRRAPKTVAARLKPKPRGRNNDFQHDLATGCPSALAALMRGTRETGPPIRIATKNNEQRPPPPSTTRPGESFNNLTTNNNDNISTHNHDSTQRATWQPQPSIKK